jgi:CRISPR/Cas system CMR subunit Cmr4 (Cas7 group RAMP superfamily)
MGVRQSLHQLEQAFVEETIADRERRERLQRQIELRGRKRELDKVHKKGSFRFVLLCLVLVATAVLGTVAMFVTLYYVMG